MAGSRQINANSGYFDWRSTDITSPWLSLIENHHIGVPKGSTLIDSPHTLDEYPVITESLVGRGYSDGEIRKILGGNWMRIYREVIG